MISTLVVLMCTAQPMQLPSFQGLAEFLALHPGCAAVTTSQALGPTGDLVPLGFFECMVRGQAMAADLFLIRTHASHLAKFWCVPLPEAAVRASIYRQDI